MPRKHQQRSLLTKPSSSAPTNLTLSSTSTNQHGFIQRSVNDLIRESRRGQGLLQPTHVPQSSSSLPPSIRAVLDIPSPTPPPPRQGLRGPNRVRRIPGPPPPPSWLNKSRHADPRIGREANSLSRNQMRIVSNASILPDSSFPSIESLQHLVLRSMALNWQWHVEYDHSYLTDLPISLKEILLSYVSIYGEHDGPNPLRVLFPSSTDDNEVNQVLRLDLGNAIGGWSSVRQIEKDLSSSPKRGDSVMSTPAIQTVPDAWDEDVPEAVQIPTLVPSPIPHSRFQHLKHLSLAAVPGTSGTTASWQELLSLAVKLPTISSLSLAYWPQPTYTPNASKGRFKVSTVNPGSSPSVIFGGSDFYTAFDNNWREAAGILRTLSRSLYCLKWLDLTGCGEWFPALTWQPEHDENASSSCGPDWNGTWRGIEHLVLAVGWKPEVLASDSEIATITVSNGSKRSDRTSSESERVNEILTGLSRTRLGQHDGLQAEETLSWDVEQEREKHRHRKEVERFMELWNCAKKVAQDLRIIRKESGTGWIHVDFGSKDEAYPEQI